ncbi:uncharacterized protein LOC125517541 isoform X2 [Triticum urartu]|uniref:uncharacterized protein LOC125517541 isoform X2 n=2 Tax=Triticum TaxID=4564 RepID=UPI0020440B10|nr:uncharacterized protein LOC125517541 isoform X2 [Triticum urartu]
MVSMEKWRRTVAAAVVAIMVLAAAADQAAPQRILLDTDMDTDDLLALMYILKQNRSEFELKAVTINVNAWSDAGHAVNHLYDILYMMGRDDILVGIGGDGGISDAGTIYPNVGGYLPLIDQGITTVGDCRYRKAVPLEGGGRLDIDTNWGIRRSFLPQGNRRYIPFQQPTTQQVMIDTISAGPTTVILTGSHTNFAIFLMTYPHLKGNVKHIYTMGGGVRSKNPTGCCPKDVTTACTPQQCGDIGNLFSSYSTNPYAEFNIFGDPFAAYQVFHSGIPITLVPLDATNTIPVNEEFFYAFQQHQSTFEAEYCFKSLKMARDTWPDDQFHASYFMWDSFTSGVAISSMRNDKLHGNDFAELEYMNITVITSNEPYGIYDGSNPLFDGHAVPKFGLKKGGVHSGHVQTGIIDGFCLIEGSRKGRCEVLTLRDNTGHFDITAQFPFYREVLYKPNFVNKSRGKVTIFDMDMSAGDFVSLIYLLKAPVEEIDLKGIFVSGNGWANAATIDIVYDILHMMGRDDIPVGRGTSTALGTGILGCKYVNAIPQGSGGLLDSDTLYGLARSLPQSPRRYTAENSVEHGAPRNTGNPELRQPLAFEVWQSVKKQLDPSEKITILTNGPLTNLANIVLSDRNASSVIKSVYVVGGHIRDENDSNGNVFTVPSNRYAEFNLFLDPLAAKVVLESTMDITLIPLSSQRKASSFQTLLESLEYAENTPESSFVLHLLSLLHDLQQKHQLYHHMGIFLGELLGAVYLVEGSNMQHSLLLKPISIIADNTTSTDGQVVVDEQSANLVKVLVDFDSDEYYSRVANRLGNMERSAVIGSFAEQRASWSRQPDNLRVR